MASLPVPAPGPNRLLGRAAYAAAAAALTVLIVLLFRGSAAVQERFVDLRSGADWSLHAGDLPVDDAAGKLPVDLRQFTAGKPPTNAGSDGTPVDPRQGAADRLPADAVSDQLPAAAAEAADWTPVDPRRTFEPLLPADYIGYYWLRVTLPGRAEADYRDPQLFLKGFAHVQLFTEHRKLYEYNMRNRDLRVNEMLRWEMVPLEAGDLGETLYIRVYQSDGKPGFSASLLGERSDLLLHMLQRDLLRTLLCVLFLALSAASLLIWAYRPVDRIYFHFGLLAACNGYGSIGRSEIIQLITDNPLPVYYHNLAAIAGAGALFAFLGETDTLRGNRYLRWFARWMAVQTVVAAVAAWRGSELYDLLTHGFYLSVTVPMAVVTLTQLLRSYKRKRSPETVWILGGFLLIAVFSLLQYIQVNVYSYTDRLFGSHSLVTVYLNEAQIVVGGFLFTLCLGAVLILRYRETHRRVIVYAEELERSNRRLREVDRIKDDFLARTSHELRTPLYGIIGLAESLADRNGAIGEAELDRRLSFIIASGRRLTRLIDHILDLSKMRHNDLALQIRPVDVRQAVDVTLTLLGENARSKGLELRAELPSDLPLAAADEDRLEQALINLVGNAIAYTDTGSVVVGASADGTDGRIAVSVTDTGIGIGPEDLEAVFEPFVQARKDADRAPAGTGLGLAITRQLIELHGGELTAESRLGEGSTFRFTLPVWDRTGADAVPAMSVESDAAGPSGGPTAPGRRGVSAWSGEPGTAPVMAGTAPSGFGVSADYREPGTVPVPEEKRKLSVSAVPAAAEAAARADYGTVVEHGADTGEAAQLRFALPAVLVVDDEPVNLEVIASQLAPAYRVFKTADPAAALAWVEQGGRPDVLLLDVMMPRMNGFELSRRIRTRYRDVELPIIVLTARNQPGDLEEGFAAGANDYLAKPVARSELLSRVALHLRLAKWNQSLEEEVRERTARIESSNLHLRASIKETMDALEHVVIMEERSRIAREIHDTVGYAMTATVVQLEAARALLQRDKANALDKLDNASELIRKGLADIRSVIHLMGADTSDQGEWTEELRRLVRDTERSTGVAVDVHIGALPKLDAMQQKVIYHALQEGLTNGIKHGRASRFEFTLSLHDRKLHFVLKNDGAPYERSAYGFGLSAMRERTAHIGGSMELAAEPPWSFVLRLRIPYADPDGKF